MRHFWLVGLAVSSLAFAQERTLMDVDVPEGILTQWLAGTENAPTATVRNLSNADLPLTALIMVPSKSPSSSVVARQDVTVPRNRATALGFSLDARCVPPGQPVWLVLVPKTGRQAAVWKALGHQAGWAPNVIGTPPTLRVETGRFPWTGARGVEGSVRLKAPYAPTLVSRACRLDSGLMKVVLSTVTGPPPGSVTLTLHNAGRTPVEVQAVPVESEPWLRFEVPAGQRLHAGTYTVASGLRSGASDVALTLNARWPLWWAVALILFAVGLGWVIPFLRQRVNVGLELLQDVAGAKQGAQALEDAVMPVEGSPTQRTGYLGASSHRERLDEIERAAQERKWRSRDFDDLLAFLLMTFRRRGGARPAPTSHAELDELRKRLTEEQEFVQPWQTFRVVWRELRSQVERLEALPPHVTRLLAHRLAQVQAVRDGRYTPTTTMGAPTISPTPMQQDVSARNIASWHKEVSDAATLANALVEQRIDQFDSVIASHTGATGQAGEVLAELVAARDRLRGLAEGNPNYVQAWQSLRVVADRYDATFEQALALQAKLLALRARPTVRGLVGARSLVSSHRQALNLPAPGAVPPRSEERPNERQRVLYRRWRVGIGAVLFLLIAVFSVVTGVQENYLDNATFGADGWDVFKVFAWGVGLSGGTSLLLQFLNAVPRTVASK